MLRKKAAFITAGFIALGLSLPAFAADSPAQARGVDSSSAVPLTRPEEATGLVAARVNGVPIPLEAVLRMLSSNVPPKGHGAGAPPDMAAAREEALKRLIFRELAYQKAKATGLVPGAAEVDTALSSLRTNAGEAGVARLLQKEGWTEEDLRFQIERKLAIERIVAREVGERTSVSQVDLQKLYEQEKQAYFTPEKMKVTDLIFFLDPQSSDSRSKAEAVLKGLKDDRDLWTLVPDGTFIVRDTEVDPGTDRELYEAGRKLKNAELSGIFSAAGSLHVIKLKEYTPAKQASFEEVRGELEKREKAKARQKRLREWEAELRAEASIVVPEAGQINRGPGRP